MSAVIVYFSLYNNTKTAAEYLAAKANINLVRLQGNGSFNPLKSMLGGSVTPQGDPWLEIREHDRVVLMAPVYAFNGVPEVRGFLNKADLRGKQVLIISSGLAGEGTFSGKINQQYTHMIEKSGGKVDLTLYHKGGEYQKFSGEAHMQAQVDALLPQVQAWLRG